MAEKRKKVFYTSPSGVAVFPWLNKPDTKFKDAGEFHVKLKVPAEQAQPLIDKLQPLYDASEAEAKKNPKRKGKRDLPMQPFFENETDDNGDETGFVTFNFKKLASGINKETKQPWTAKVDLFDSRMQALPSDAKVYGGSVIKVSFQVFPYDTPKAIGIKLAMDAVQVLKLVEGSSRSAESYGFANEGGNEDAEDADDTSTDDDDDATDDGDNSDF